MLTDNNSNIYLVYNIILLLILLSMFIAKVVIFDHFITTSQYKVYVLSMFTIKVVIFNSLLLTL